MTPFILASGSAIRAQLLRQAGVGFERIPADIDEDAIKDEALLRGLSQKAVALRLAEAKAVHISRLHRGIVLGADQVLQLEKDLISKSATLDEARDLLRRMSGKSHYLHAGSALAENGRVLWSDVQSAELVVRRLSDSFIDAYLAKEGEKLLSSVGCYQLEGAGVHLFEAIRGDYFTVLGLPMLPLLAQLRHMGVVSA